jgi:hypothetical protein
LLPIEGMLGYHQIRSFLTVVEEGSLHRAAARLRGASSDFPTIF